MSRNESEEKFWQEHVQPGIEAFHAAHPLKWMVQPPDKSDEPAPEPDKDSTDPENSEDDEGVPGVLGKDFLDRTNIWLLRPELTPEEKLSTWGRVYVEEIEWVFDKAKQKLVKAGGQGELEPVIISDQTIDDYLATVKSKIVDDQEYQYIANIINKLIKELQGLQMTLRFYNEIGKPIPPDIASPQHRTKPHWSSPR